MRVTAKTAKPTVSVGRDDSSNVVTQRLVNAYGREVDSALRIGMLVTPQHAPRPQLAAHLDTIRSAINQRPAPDIVLAREWFFGLPTKLYSPSEVQHIRTSLEAMTRGKDLLLVPGTIAWQDTNGEYRNTALVISNGKTLLDYDKKRDGDDIDYGKALGVKWRPGKTKGLFEWRGYTVGLEICADHSKQTLKRDLKADRVDLHLVTSYGVVSKSASVAAKLDGLIINDEGTVYGPEVMRKVPVTPEDKALYPRKQDAFVFYDAVSTKPVGENVKLHSFVVAAPEPRKAGWSPVTSPRR